MFIKQIGSQFNLHIYLFIKTTSWLLLQFLNNNSRKYWSSQTKIQEETHSEGNSERIKHRTSFIQYMRMLVWTVVCQESVK